ncbi:MAG: type II toxin-antitoxin system VapC family toxin [Terrimicrobiaceae bacterium]
MSAVAVDTSVLLAIFKGEPRGELWLDCLQSAAETATLLVSSVVLAAVRSFFPSDDAYRNALRGIGLRHTPFTEEASLLAGRILRTYRDEGGARKTILPDSLVAAHAATRADSLATEDRGDLRSYFPAVRLLTVDRS